MEMGLRTLTFSMLSVCKLTLSGGYELMIISDIGTGCDQLYITENERPRRKGQLGLIGLYAKNMPCLLV